MGHPQAQVNAFDDGVREVLLTIGVDADTTGYILKSAQAGFDLGKALQNPDVQNALIGAGVGGLGGAIFDPFEDRLTSTLAGAGLGGLGGYGVGRVYRGLQPDAASFADQQAQAAINAKLKKNQEITAGDLATLSPGARAKFLNENPQHSQKGLWDDWTSLGTADPAKGTRGKAYQAAHARDSVRREVLTGKSDAQRLAEHRARLELSGDQYKHLTPEQYQAEFAAQVQFMLRHGDDYLNALDRGSQTFHPQGPSSQVTASPKTQQPQAPAPQVDTTGSDAKFQGWSTAQPQIVAPSAVKPVGPTAGDASPTKSPTQGVPPAAPPNAVAVGGGYVPSAPPPGSPDAAVVPEDWTLRAGMRYRFDEEPAASSPAAVDPVAAEELRTRGQQVQQGYQGNPSDAKFSGTFPGNRRANQAQTGQSSMGQQPQLDPRVAELQEQLAAQRQQLEEQYARGEQIRQFANQQALEEARRYLSENRSWVDAVRQGVRSVAPFSEDTPMYVDTYRGLAPQIQALPSGPRAYVLQELLKQYPQDRDFILGMMK